MLSVKEKKFVTTRLHVCKQVHQDDIYGLSCQKSTGRHPRNSHTNDFIKITLVSRGIAATREPQGVSRSDGKRPDDMSMYLWKKGKLLLWDFTCGDTLAPVHADQASKETGKVASDAENRKIKHYESLTNSYHFVPVYIETLGVRGKMGLAFIKEDGKKIMEQTGEKDPPLFYYNQ